MKKAPTYTVKEVNDIEELNECKFLLYESYILHHEWQVELPNPSNLKINLIDGKLCLADDFDQISIWFAIRANSELIGCARICHPDAHGLLEIERYSAAVDTLKPILTNNKGNIVELNREAVLPTYQYDRNIYLLLLKSVFEYALKHTYSIITTCNLLDWVEIYNDISLPIYAKDSFKYHHSDPQPVTIYFAEQHKLINSIASINFFLNQYHI